MRLTPPVEKEVGIDHLPPPDIIEDKTFEPIKAELIAEFKKRCPEYQGYTESDPLLKFIEVSAYRELKFRERINEACRQVLLTHSKGTNLDYVASLYGIIRAVVRFNDAKKSPDFIESDARLRKRSQLMLESLTTAGSREGYIAHGLNAHPFVNDVYATCSKPGHVLIYVLSNQGNGTPDQTLLDTVNAYLNEDEIRPLTDFVEVLPAEVIEFNVKAMLHFKEHRYSDVALDQARKAVTDYLNEQWKLGSRVYRSTLHSLLHQAGVDHVELFEPAADIQVDSTTSAYCKAINIDARIPEDVL